MRTPCGCGCGGHPVMGQFLKGHNSKLRQSKAQHGDLSRYKAGCRCDPCRVANRLSKRRQARARGVRTVAEAAAARRIPRPPKPKPPTIAERFAAGYRKLDDGCWVWLKATGPTGYGVAWNGHRTMGAHRLSYEIHVGPIPDGLHIDHLCCNPTCVNPDHLEPVTQQENNRRAAAKRRAS